MDMIRNLFIFSLLGLLVSSCSTLVGPKGIHETTCVKFVECVEAPITIELPTHEKLLSLGPPKESITRYSYNVSRCTEDSR